MSLYIIGKVPVPIDVNTYLGNSKQYTHIHVEYPYIKMSREPYIPLMEVHV